MCGQHSGDTRHPLPSPVADFLNGERRQVWAVHRETGEPFFLAEGEAKTQREFAKTSLRCPYPGCTVPISTRGGTKRDHFFHVNRPPHETGRESEFHLAGKAMLAQWAATRLPEGAVVQEEQTVKDPSTRLLRRADVMVTGRSGRRVAYEVEYKAFAVEDWRRKQADYDGEGVACAWLLGHTRVRMATGPAYLVGLGETAVKFPQLAAEIAAGGYPLLVVNPTTREVGTLAGDVYFSRPFRGGDTTAWMSVDPLDECAFEPRRGLITPTMRRIEANGAEGSARSMLVAQAGETAARQRMGAPERLWEGSRLRSVFWRRWGGVLPELAVASPGGEAIHALPVHWHGALYEELLRGCGPHNDFRWRDVFGALDKHGIRRSPDTNAVYAALTAYLEALQRLGLVKIHRDSKRRVLLFSPTDGDFNDAGVIETPEAPRRGRLP